MLLTKNDVMVIIVSDNFRVESFIIEVNYENDN